jgi:hypothetical protein
MHKKILILIVAIFVILLATGFLTKVYLGDECYHYRQARIYHSTKTRPVWDPIYEHLPRLGYRFTDGPLWYMGLAGLWGLIGNDSFYAAQVYQASFFPLLLLSLYLLAKEMYRDKVALLSVVLISSIPLFIVLGIVFYQDIPLVSLLTFSLYLLYKKRYILSGLIFGLSILMKLNALMMLPFFLILIPFHKNGNFLKKTGSVLRFMLPVLCINIPDAIFRHQNFGYIYYTAPYYIPKNMDYYSPGLITNGLLNIFRFLGIAFIGSLCLYVLLKRFQKKDLFLLIPSIGYFLFFLVLFRKNPDVRYLLPIIPMLAILAAKGMCLPNKSLIVKSVMTICIFQSLFTLGFVYRSRQVSKDIESSFDFIRGNIPQQAAILYPEENLVTYTNHPIAWGRVLEISDLFWGESEEKMLAVLNDYSIEYIAVKRSRVYDDSKVRHTGGYPASFIVKLPVLSYLTLVFENREVSIWQVNKAS